MDSVASKFLMLTDEQLCIGCKACEVHCKVKNNVPAGLKLGVLIQSGPALHDGQVEMHARYMPCLHCTDAPCVPVCPTEAVIQRADGIVFIEESLCIGCRACEEACPWGVPQFDAVAGVMLKCDLCRDRIDAGKQPACVTGCTMSALSLISTDK